MKCLILQPIHDDGLDMLRSAGIEPVTCYDTSPETVLRRLPECEAVITRDIGFPTAFFPGATRLRAIVVHGAGYDAVDVRTATARGILVCNSPGFNARSVSELALGLALAAARLIPAADQAERQGLRGFRERHAFNELFGKTALIVGFGATGAGLAGMLKSAFSMRVLVYSPRAAVTDNFEHVTDLAAGLAAADLISLHTPLRDETRNLIGRDTLEFVKPGAILVNTARAGLVDEAALAEALGAGRIAAAGLDVYSRDAPAGPLGAFDRVIFTPHLGGTTNEALKRTAEGAAQNIISALAGKTPSTALNAPVGEYAALPGK